jgi:hypothetical protein
MANLFMAFEPLQSFPWITAIQTVWTVTVLSLLS